MMGAISPTKQLFALFHRARTLLRDMANPRAVVEEPDAIASAEHYRDGDALVIYDARNPLAWIESDSHATLDRVADLGARSKHERHEGRDERTPRRPYNHSDK